MYSLKRFMAAGALAASIVGCSDNVSPSSVDASSMNSSVGGITTTFANNAAFQSMSQLVAVFPQYAAVSLLQVAMPKLPQGVLSSRLQAARMLVLSHLSNPDALFPVNVLGKTLAWDVNTSTYKPDTTATGAPAAGIRIIIYTVNAGGQPVVPLQQLGYVDLTDESTPSANKLGVLLKLGSTTIADYAITSISGTNSGSVEAIGFIQDVTGNAHVDYDFLTSLSQTAFISMGDLVGSNGGHIHSSITITNTAATLDVTITKDKNSIELLATGDSTITGSVKYNGTTIATISGDGNPPIFTAANGHTLSASESTALAAIFVAALDVVDTFANAVFGPGSVVFH